MEAKFFKRTRYNGARYGFRKRRFYRLSPLFGRFYFIIPPHKAVPRGVCARVRERASLRFVSARARAPLCVCVFVCVWDESTLLAVTEWQVEGEYGSHIHAHTRSLSQR